MRIPTGNFGNTVAQPQQAVRAADTTAPGQALQRAGEVGANIATEQMAAQTRLDLQRKDLEERTTAARVRTQTVNDLADAEDALKADILAGRVHKDKAEEEWQARTAELLKGRMDGVAPDLAGTLSVEFEGLTRRGLSGVRAAAAKRGQEDTRANLVALDEQYQRMAARDRPRAIAEYEAQMDALGPAAGFGPDDIAKAKQGFRERTAYTQAFSLVRGASRDLGAVRKAREALDGDGFADLDPQRRAALDAQLEGYETNILQRQEIAAQRAARQAEASLNRARAAYEAAQGRADAGIPDSLEQVEATTRALAGTPYLDTYRAVQAQARAVGGTAAQPISAQRAALDQVIQQIAQHGASDALLRRRAALEKVLSASESDLQKDPLRAGLERGVITELPPIDLSNLDAATKSLAGRMQAAQVVGAWAGKPVTPLTREEADRFADMLKALPAQQLSSALATTAQALGPKTAAALAQQIAPKDEAIGLALGMASSKTTAGRYTSELLLKGSRALAEKSIKADNAADSGWRAQIAQELEGVYPNQAMRDAAAKAAYLVTAGMAAEGGVGAAEAKRAVRLVVGGSIVEHNGGRIPLPAGVDAGDLDKRLRTVRPQDFAGQAPDGKVRIAGQEAGLDAFVAALPDAQLLYAGPGRFNVVAGGRIVTNTRGQRIAVEVKPNAR